MAFWNSVRTFFRGVFLFSTLCTVFILAGCVTGARGPDSKRAAIDNMAGDALTKLYGQKPHVKAQIEAAPGYAVFSNANVNVVLASFAGGYGVVVEKASEERTYMRMGEVGVGLGLGVKDYRVIMVFDNLNTLRNFRDNGWVFGAQADAAAKASDTGGSASGEFVLNGITLYQITQSGLALQATIKGTKFWKDKSLNK